MFFGLMVFIRHGVYMLCSVETLCCMLILFSNSVIISAQGLDEGVEKIIHLCCGYPCYLVRKNLIPLQ